MSEGIKTFILMYMYLCLHLARQSHFTRSIQQKDDVATNIIKHFRETTALLQDPLGERSVREIS